MCLQYMHIPDRERCNWLRERIETPEEVRPFFLFVMIQVALARRPDRISHNVSRYTSFCMRSSL